MLGGRCSILKLVNRSCCLLVYVSSFLVIVEGCAHYGGGKKSPHAWRRYNLYSKMPIVYCHNSLPLSVARISSRTSSCCSRSKVPFMDITPVEALMANTRWAPLVIAYSIMSSSPSVADT